MLHPVGVFAPGSGTVAAGDWLVTPLLFGPAGAKGDAPVEVATTMTATAAAFDPAVSSPTGDLWLDAVHSDAGITPTSSTRIAASQSR